MSKIILFLIVLFLLLNFRLLKYYFVNYNLLKSFAKIIFLWYIVELINAQFSGDLTSAKGLYMFILLIVRKKAIDRQLFNINN